MPKTTGQTGAQVVPSFACEGVNVHKADSHHNSIQQLHNTTQTRSLPKPDAATGAKLRRNETEPQTCCERAAKPNHTASLGSSPATNNRYNYRLLLFECDHGRLFCLGANGIVFIFEQGSAKCETAQAPDPRHSPTEPHRVSRKFPF
jgi:hypothetical protein